MPNKIVQSVLFFPQNQLFLIFANLIDATSGTEIIHCTFNALMQC